MVVRDIQDIEEGAYQPFLYGSIVLVYASRGQSFWDCPETPTKERLNGDLKLQSAHCGGAIRN